MQQCGEHRIESLTGICRGVNEIGAFVQYFGTSSVQQGRSAATSWLHTPRNFIALQRAQLTDWHRCITYSNNCTDVLVIGRCGYTLMQVQITSTDMNFNALLVHVMDPRFPATAGHKSCSHSSLRLCCKPIVAQAAPLQRRRFQRRQQCRELRRCGRWRPTPLLRNKMRRIRRSGFSS